LLRYNHIIAMLRYHLDDLGSYQFEKLTQSALRAAVSLGVESWGNRGDWGRDSYCAGALRFPDRDVPTGGPFIFQTKFVEGANAAGARPRSALLSSACKEVNRITERVNKRRWKNPAYFTFITNAPVAAALREEIRAQFAKVMPLAGVLVWGGDDVCDVLDRFSGIARSFPQLLSIRDLDELIERVLTKESRERSQTALQIARELVPVFAPTSSQERAWKILRRHHFAVLEGPPEVGKSAIAWMVGLTQAAQGWETVVCNTPDIFFQLINGAKRQVFIADDAFGRTEYDPTRTSQWEADLDMVLHRIDPRHWLIWTSRKHILERACARMDAQGKARSFPDPGSVLVDVSELSVEEKALILFRHARSAGLERQARSVVRKNAGDIVTDAEFTPERIRRFVHESLPRIVSGLESEGIKAAQVSSAIREALRNPTKQMRLTFQRLPMAYKWLLVALLEVPTSTVATVIDLQRLGNVENLRTLYDTYCPDEDHEPFASVLDHLTEAFVKVRSTTWDKPVVDWIHPSYRDLVIDELIQDASLRNTFLRRATLEGVKLAVSDTGGELGNRTMPLVRSAESWDILQERCIALIDSDLGDREILETVANAASDGKSEAQRRRWGVLIASCCRRVAGKWDAQKRTISPLELTALINARRYASPVPALPGLLNTWQELDELFRESLRIARGARPMQYEAFDNLTAYARALRDCAPEFLTERGFPDRYNAEIAEVLVDAEAEADEIPDGTPDELRELAGRADEIATVVDRLADFSEDYHRQASVLAQRLRRHSTRLEESAAEAEPGEPDYYDDDRGDGRDRAAREETITFDVDMLFREL
jgi:hypothetical protein